MMLLSLTQSLLVFYLLFCVARMNWAGPFELGDLRRREQLVRRPPRLCHLDRDGGADGRSGRDAADRAAGDAAARLAVGWLAIGSLTLVVGFLPVWLFMVRRPEDLGLLPIGAAARRGHRRPSAASSTSRVSRAEQAVGTAAFWLLLLYTVLVYPVQAGVSLHQAAHLIERGIAPTIAATIVSTFSLMSAVASARLRVPAAPVADPLSAGARSACF